jgi:hypothetical protein
MNHKFQPRIFFILITLGLLAPLSYSQLPTYKMTISNDAVVAPNVYEFDIYLLRTGTNLFQLFGFQIGILYDSTSLKGGTLTASWVPGSNDKSLISTKQVSTSINTNRVGLIKIDPKISLRFGEGSIIKSSGSGTKIGRLRLTSTRPFDPQKLNLSWSFALPWKTKIAAYDYKTHLSADITSPANHFISLHKKNNIHYVPK